MSTTRQSQSPEAGPPPGGSGIEASGKQHDQQVRGSAGGARTMRLTGRGAVLVVFVACLAGAYATETSAWNPAAGVAYVAACVLVAWKVKLGQLLTAVVTPPLLFGIAVVGVKAATATGTVLTATTEGTLLMLGNSAPWLFGGTMLAFLIACARGLPRDIRELRAGLRGDHGIR